MLKFVLSVEETEGEDAGECARAMVSLEELAKISKYHQRAIVMDMFDNLMTTIVEAADE